MFQGITFPSDTGLDRPKNGFFARFHRVMPKVATSAPQFPAQLPSNPALVAFGVRICGKPATVFPNSRHETASVFVPLTMPR